MIFAKIKKLIGKLKKPKFDPDQTTSSIEHVTIESPINETTNFEFTVPQNKEEMLTTPEPIVEIKFVDETFCNNCVLPMIEKTEGIINRRKKSKPKKCLVCSNCGFERRLNY